MANVEINGVQYLTVPEVDIPKVGGGIAKFFDTSSASATAAALLSGETAYGAAGEISGNMPNNGSVSGSIGTKAGNVVIPPGYTTGGTVSLTNVSDLTSANLKSGVSVLGVTGSLALPSISQDSTTKVLTIS